MCVAITSCAAGTCYSEIVLVRSCQVDRTLTFGVANISNAADLFSYARVTKAYYGTNLL